LRATKSRRLTIVKKGFDWIYGSAEADYLIHGESAFESALSGALVGDVDFLGTAIGRAHSHNEARRHQQVIAELPKRTLFAEAGASRQGVPAFHLRKIAAWKRGSCNKEITALLAIRSRRDFAPFPGCVCRTSSLRPENWRAACRFPRRFWSHSRRCASAPRGRTAFRCSLPTSPAQLS
jgi:hypothetical protein